MASTLAVGLAQSSGEELAQQVQTTALVRAHTQAGEEVLPWALLVTVAAGAETFAEPFRRRFGGPSTRLVTGGLVALALVAGVGATVAVAQVGHSGAKATWSKVLTTPTGG